MSKTKTKKKSKIENLLNDFKENEITISEYRDFVKARLEKLLADFGSSHFLFENRIKEYDSIKGKLIKNRWLQKSSSIHAIKRS